MAERDAAVNAEGLTKSYGKTKALDGLDLVVAEGTVLGVLGPNGAGKTTAVRILTTLLQPDGGRASVAGFDVVTQAHEVRARIGLTGQYAAVDEYLTGRENLEMVGRLYQLTRTAALRRAEELLERFDLVPAGGGLAKTYSGGMRRRLDLAASLVVSPQVLFLDEPTTGLDPRSRLTMWEIIEELVREGTSLLLTTQYLDEADALADVIAVVDGGRVIATGTADELKTRVGRDTLDVVIARGADLEGAVRVIAPYAAGAPEVNARQRRVTAPITTGARVVPDVIRDLDAAGVPLDDIAVRRPSLDDVFLTLTGHTTAEVADATLPQQRRQA